MAGQHPLVALAVALADLLAEHAVVLHEVDDLEERESHDGLDDEVRRDLQAERREDHAQRTSDISQALSTSLSRRHGLCLRRASRRFSSRQADVTEPPTVRGQNW